MTFRSDVSACLRVRTIFRNQPGVHDLSADSATSRFLRPKSQLRIPHAALASFWKRTEIAQRQGAPFIKNKRTLRRAAYLAKVSSLFVQNLTFRLVEFPLSTT